MTATLRFETSTVSATLVLPDGESVTMPVEIRTHPVTGRTCRIAFSRSDESEPGVERLLPPPPKLLNIDDCPFCKANIPSRTPRLRPELAPEGRMRRGRSVLFPNLFPYGGYSAVNVFENGHFVEIGAADAADYADGFVNAADYLERVLAHDPAAVFMAVTQNHLPSAGGSLVHPHLQINADAVAANHHRFLLHRAETHFQKTGRRLFSDYLAHERADARRFIGAVGDWEWVAAFAPEGFYELWAVLPGVTSFRQVDESGWRALAEGVVKAQRFYRSLDRNGYNFGLLLVESGQTALELRAVMIVRSNFAPWVRNDHTGFEVMLGDMATFTPPEETARMARSFWTG